MGEIEEVMSKRGDSEGDEGDKRQEGMEGMERRNIAQKKTSGG